MKKRLRFLSDRIKILVVVYFSTLLVLVCMSAVALGGGAPVWPLALVGGLTLALLAVFYFAVMRPYMRMERMMKLFLDGYTISGIAEGSGVQLTPATERMTRKILEEYNSTSLLKLSKRQAQYRALQSQINPHFLYNTLESIRSEALIAGLTSVADMTEALAVFFRYTISKV